MTFQCLASLFGHICKHLWFHVLYDPFSNFESCFSYFFPIFMNQIKLSKLELTQVRVDSEHLIATDWYLTMGFCSEPLCCWPRIALKLTSRFPLGFGRVQGFRLIVLIWGCYQNIKSTQDSFRTVLFSFSNQSLLSSKCIIVLAQFL